MQICEAKRSATTGSSAEDPVHVESPDKAAAGPQKRFSAFEFDEERTSRSTSPTLVIAEDEPIADASASQAAESLHVPTPRTRLADEPVPESPRSPSPSPPAESSASHGGGSTFNPCSENAAARTPMPHPEYTADDEAAHVSYTSPHFEQRSDSTSTSASPAPQSSRASIDADESSRYAAAWFPPEPIVNLPKPQSRALDPTRDAVAVVVVMNAYTLKKSGRQIELVRRVVVQRAGETLYNRRIEIRAPTLLNVLGVDRTSPDDWAAQLTTYAEMARELALQLPRYFCVFHDRARTLSALRLALPIERTFDLGLHVHLRNDALRRGGKNVTRSRHRVVPLEDLWQPLLGYSMPNPLISRADGVLRIFTRIARAIGLTPQVPSTNVTPQLEWLSRGEVVYELSASLLIEEEVVAKAGGNLRESLRDADELLPPKKGTAPFRFELQRVVGIDLRRFETVNQLFTLAPHFGLAFLRLLVENDLVPADYPTELVNRQKSRLAAHDASLVKYLLNVNAPDAESKATAAAAIEDFLMLDDARIAALAERIGFPEFEAVEIVRRA